MKNRLQLRYHFPDKLPTRNEAINYINDIFSIDANDGLTSLIAEPLVVFYNDDTTLNHRRSIESANVILAIGRGGNGINVEKNKDYFIIDFAKNVEDIYKINEIIGDVNDDKSKSSIYGLIAKNLELIENETIRTTEIDKNLTQLIEETKNDILNRINVLNENIINEISRAREKENELFSKLDTTKTNLQEQITKNKVISSDKTITFNTNSSNTDISVNVDNETITIDEQTGNLSVNPEAFIKYDGENAIQINDKENYTKEISLVINSNDKILSNDTEGLKSTLSLEYIKDDENKPLLRLIGKNSEIISSINVSDFINDGMIESVELKDIENKKYLVITWNTAAGKDVSTLEVSSLIDVYTAGNGIKLNNNEFSIKLRDEQTLLASDGLGLYVNEDVLNTKIKSNTENLIKEEIAIRFNESKEYTNQQISEVEEDISHYISDLKEDIETSEQNTKHYTDDIKKVIDSDIDGLQSNIDSLNTNIDTLTNTSNTHLSEINNLSKNKVDTIKIAGTVISSNNSEVNIPLNIGLEVVNNAISLQLSNDFNTTAEGITISDEFKNNITSDINTAEQNAKGYAKDYTDAAVEAQAEVDAAQNDRLDAIETAMGDWTAEAQALVDAAQDKAITDGDADTLKSAKDYTDEKVEGLETADTELHKEINKHIENTYIHVTTEDKDKWDAAVSKIDTFLVDADLAENAIDTLKELQEYIESDGSTANELISRVDANEAILDGYGEGKKFTTVKDELNDLNLNVNSLLNNFKDLIGEIYTIKKTADEFKENKTFGITSALYKTNDGILICDNNGWSIRGIKLTHIKDGKVKTCYNTNTPSGVDSYIEWSEWKDYYEDGIITIIGNPDDDDNRLSLYGINNKYNTILAGYGTNEDETLTVKLDIRNLQSQIDAIHTHDNKDILDDITAERVRAWGAAEQNAKDYAKDYTDAEAILRERSDNILSSKLDTAQAAIGNWTAEIQAQKDAEQDKAIEKVQEAIENIGTINGDINTNKNGVQLINDNDKCGLLFTKDNKQRLITFDGIIERLFDNENNKWDNNWTNFVTWDNNIPTEPTTPEVSGQTLDIQNNGTVLNQTLDIQNNGTVEDKILTIRK